MCIINDLRVAAVKKRCMGGGGKCNDQAIDDDVSGWFVLPHCLLHVQLGHPLQQPSGLADVCDPPVTVLVSFAYAM